MRKQAIAD